MDVRPFATMNLSQRYRLANLSSGTRLAYTIKCCAKTHRLSSCYEFIVIEFAWS